MILRGTTFFEQILLIMAQDSGQVHKICWFWCKTERSKNNSRILIKSSDVERMQDQYSEFQTRFFIFKHLVPMTSVDTCSFSCKFCFVATDLQNLLFEKYFLSSELHNIICGCRKDYICTKGSLFCA